MEHQEILDFINRFTRNGQLTEVIECFSNGCCFWFAKILYDRFCEVSPTIVYDEVYNHFACRIYDRVYDIRGDITEKNYGWVPWEVVIKQDPNHAYRITQDCINFIPREVDI